MIHLMKPNCPTFTHIYETTKYPRFKIANLHVILLTRTCIVMVHYTQCLWIDILGDGSTQQHMPCNYMAMPIFISPPWPTTIPMPCHARHLLWVPPTMPIIYICSPPTFLQWFSTCFVTYLACDPFITIFGI